MYVLNENGVFVSWYFFGVGVWMVLFVVWGKLIWGYFLVGLIMVVVILGVGCELVGNGVGLLVGLLIVVVLGMVLFSNFLLFYYLVLVGLFVFIYGFLRM